MGKTVRVGVIGTGALGKEHARIFAELARQGEVAFAGVYDTRTEAAEWTARRHRVSRFRSIEEIAGACDALSLVTPTPTHYPLGRDLLTAGKHLLIEKPITDDTQQAMELIELARLHGCLLQVGHVERFNPVFQYVTRVATAPRFIETHRLSPFPKRSTDISVVLDLMIHDLDIVLAFVRSEVAGVEAIGVPILSSSADIANARVRFQNGCVANLTASRVSPERMRKIRVFSGGEHTSYVSLDYQAQAGFIYRLAEGNEKSSGLWRRLLASRKTTITSEFAGRKIVREPVPIEKREPLQLELASFVSCLTNNKAPIVSAESATRALELAKEITGQIQQ